MRSIQMKCAKLDFGAKNLPRTDFYLLNINYSEKTTTQRNMQTHSFYWRRNKYARKKNNQITN